jgi:hypothetical protein
LYLANTFSFIGIFEGLEKATRGGGGEWEPIKILLQELGYVPSPNPKAKTLQESDEHTNQHHRNDPLKVMNAAEKMGSIGHPVSKI